MKRNIYISGLFIFLFCMQIISCSRLNMKTGLYLELVAKPIEQEQEKFSVPDLEEIKDVMDRRIEALGIKAYSILLNEKEQKLVIKILNYNDLENIKSVLKQSGDVKITDEKEKVILTSSNIKSAFYKMKTLSENDIEEPVVEIQFDTEGTRLIAEGTKANIGKTLSIFIDDEIYMTLKVNEIIEDGNLIITFGRSSKHIIQIARRITAMLQGRIQATIEIIKADKNKVQISFTP